MVNVLKHNIYWASIRKHEVGEPSTSSFRYHPTTTNADRHNNRGAWKNGGNNGKWIFWTNFGKTTISL